MATRAQLQTEIAELDRQINAELGKTRLPSLNTRNASFPWSYYILAALVLAWWQFGGMLPIPGHDKYAHYAMWVGGAICVFAVIRTFLWLIRRNPKGGTKYMEATTHVRELQQRRQELQKQLKEIEG